MQTTDMPITSIKPYKRNARIIHDSAIDAVAESIKQFGFRQPIVIDNNGVVIVGHTRLLAAKKLKLKTVPVHIADTLTDEQVKAYRIADNSTSDLTDWDIPALEVELETLDVDMTAFGVPAELDSLVIIDDVEKVDPPEYSDKEPVYMWTIRLAGGDIEALRNKVESRARATGQSSEELIKELLQ